MTTLDIKSCFTCGESYLYRKTLNSQNNGQYCLKHFHIHFATLMMVQMSEDSPILAQNRKTDRRKSKSTNVETF